MTDKKNKHVQKEEEILKFWQEQKIFEKTLQKDSPQGEYVFYDGPPFATGLPHYGHIVPSLIKDAVPRFWTMQGYHIDRIWGWDCHGLPVENIVEKEMDIKSKKDIEENIGVNKFNESCRAKVYTYVDEWKKFIPRMGRWVDMENAYSTMDLNYMDSVWWVFKQLWDKDLIYESHRSMHVCPRCETTLSQSEVSQGYKDVKDISVTAKFKLIEEPDTYLIAWTTTPWTLPGNIALAVGEDIDYVKVAVENENIILAKNILEELFKDKKYKILKEFKGNKLVGKVYEPLFSYYDTPENREKGFKIYAAEFVTTDEGTGIVHVAPAFGTDDLDLGKKHDLPFIQHVDLSGHFKKEVTDLAGQLVKSVDAPQAADIEILKLLAADNKLFSKAKYEHSYPHCWRCDTPLLNYATSSWFINVTKILPRALELAKTINWMPEHIKDGRFGKWLEGAKDWSISRQRFWGSVMPIWVCDSCKEKKAFGSKSELEEIVGSKIDDLHKDKMDQLTFKCQCGGEFKRIPDVLDCWFESGSMPFARKDFEKTFPAQFIAEGVDQTRCWFYYLLVLSVGVTDQVPFENVIASGIVLAEDGQKMAKRLKNYPDPTEVINRHGADALRYYLLTSPVIKADTLSFSEKGVDEANKKLILLLNNVFSFYQMYADKEVILSDNSEEVLDKWILAKLNLLNKEITEAMKAYDLVQASRPIIGFVDEFSTWYLRRSRDRIKAGDIKALETMKYVFVNLAKLMAPFTPFIAESIYQELDQDKESVHLEDWPEFNEQLIDLKILEDMNKVREVVEKGLNLREENQIKVRQPLAKLTIPKLGLSKDLLSLVAAEVNIKEVIEGQDYELDIVLTPALKEAGLVREIIRAINSLRKKIGLSINDYTQLTYQTNESELKNILEKYKEEIMKQTRNKNITNQETESSISDNDYGQTVHEVKVNKWLLLIKLKE